MRYVELVRGRDYSGRGVKACRGEPLAVAEDKAAELVGSGFFRYLDSGMPAGGAGVAVPGADRKTAGSGAAVPGAGAGISMGTLEAECSGTGADAEQWTLTEAGMSAVQAGLLREAVSGVEAQQALAVFPPYKKSEIERMKTAELTALAEEHGIDISGCRTNAERASIILAVLQQEDAAVPDLAEDGRSQENDTVPSEDGAQPEESGVFSEEGAVPDFGEGAV